MRTRHTSGRSSDRTAAGPDRRAARRVLLLAAVLTALAPSAAQAGLFSRLAVEFQLGSLLSQKGQYNSSAALRRTVLPGAGWEFSLRYRVTGSLFIDGSFSYNWMYFRKETRPSDWVDHKPAFVAPLYSLNLTYHLPAVRGFSPFLTAGYGVCPWWFSSAVFGGEMWRSPNDQHAQFTDVSKQINAGLGFEYLLSSKLSVIGEARYYRVFVGNIARFGAFGNQALLGVRLGMAFYFGGRNPKKRPAGDAL
jgi:hypothetical protein